MKAFLGFKSYNFAVTEFNKMFSGRQLHLDAAVCPRTFFVCFLRLLDLEGGGTVRIYQLIQFSMTLL
jgi:hypothetical protein